MTEHDVVNSTKGLPATVESLTKDLTDLGVKHGMTILVHSSLSSLGWVVGGAQAVLMALDNVLTESGTLVMPTFTDSNGEPSGWSKPPVPEPWWQVIRDHMPAYDPDLSPTREMGIVSETFRKMPGVLRSSHPELSFAARGPLSEAIIDNHSLWYSLGEKSPLARIYENNGWVLLLGVGYSNNTAMHLAEYRANAPGYHEVKISAAMMVDGRREWVTYKNINYNEDLLVPVGEDFDRECPDIRIGKVAQASTRLFPQRVFVDFAIEWLKNRMPDRIKPYKS